MNSLITLGRVKVLGARVTDIKHKYWASLEIDKDIIDAAGLYEYEKILVVNIDNGERFETYVKAAPAKTQWRLCLEVRTEQKLFKMKTF